MSLIARLSVVLCFAAGIAPQAPAMKRPFNIAHRGASAYAPEHTTDAYRLAIAQDADYVEPDLGITRDGVLVVSHDPTLERTTNVEEVFPDRFTEDKTAGGTVKRWFIEDFTLAEVKRLDNGSWFGAEFRGSRVLTFQEAIDVVKGKAGLFPELKTPSRLRAKGFDVERAVADVLAKNGLVDAAFGGRPAVHLQVFEEDSLRRLAQLLPTVPRTFLIGTPAGAGRWLSAAGLREVKSFATGVGPSKDLIEQDPGIVARAHAEGLSVVPYTFQLRPAQNPYPDAPAESRAQIELAMRGLPRQPAELTAQMKKFIDVYKVDGLFTNNPDLFPR